VVKPSGTGGCYQFLKKESHEKFLPVYKDLEEIFPDPHAYFPLFLALEEGMNVALPVGEARPTASSMLWSTV